MAFILDRCAITTRRPTRGSTRRRIRHSIATEFTASLQPLLADFGTARDSTWCSSHWTRHLFAGAGSAGRCVSERVLGSPWWFLDAPDHAPLPIGRDRDDRIFALRRLRRRHRAFCSIPARHDVARRVEASFLARMVAEHRISMSRAREIVVDVIDEAPRRRSSYERLRGAPLTRRPLVRRAGSAHAHRHFGLGSFHRAHQAWLQRTRVTATSGEFVPSPVEGAPSPIRYATRGPLHAH